MKKIVQLTLLIGITNLSTTNVIDARTMHQATTTAKSTSRQISEATDTVQETIKNVQTVPTAKKAVARQEANDAVENLLATLHARTWTGDLRGYTEEQVKKACENLLLLNLEKDKVAKEITAQEATIAEMTDTRFWGLWAVVKEDKKEEYSTAIANLKNLKNRLTKVKNAIRSEEVIAGKARALSINRAAIVLGIAAAAGVAYATDAIYNDSEGIAYLKRSFGIYPYNTEASLLLRDRFSNLEKKAKQLKPESLTYIKKQIAELEELPRPYGFKRANKYVDTLEKTVNEQLEREKILSEQLEREKILREQLQNETISKKASELGQAIKRKVSTTAERAKQYLQNK